MRAIKARLRRDREDERGVEAVAMIIVLPLLFVLIMGLIDVGFMMRTRMAVENVARDAARHAAIDGGNYNARTNSTGKAWDAQAMSTLWRNNKCTQSACTGQPSVNCRSVTPVGSTVARSAQVAQRAGDIITCTVQYPYKPVTGALLSSPIGLGIGGLLKPFTVTVSARAETGVSGL